MSIFRKAVFYTTVNHLKDLPATNAEVAFVGRSNAGKSRAINTLVGQTRLAFVSKTPGRTQHINFFDLSDGRFLVDLPGYGFAQVPEAVRTHWVRLLGNYLEKRKSLIGLIQIMDIRHPLRPLDFQMLDFFAERNKPVHILLSKSDKLSRQEQQKVIHTVQAALAERALKQAVSVQLFSSLKGQGVEEVGEVVGRWFSMGDEPGGKG